MHDIEIHTHSLSYVSNSGVFEFPSRESDSKWFPILSAIFVNQNAMGIYFFLFQILVGSQSFLLFIDPIYHLVLLPVYCSNWYLVQYMNYPNLMPVSNYYNSIRSRRPIEWNQANGEKKECILWFILKWFLLLFCFLILGSYLFPASRALVRFFFYSFRTRFFRPTSV